MRLPEENSEAVVKNPISRSVEASSDPERRKENSNVVPVGHGAPNDLTYLPPPTVRSSTTSRGVTPPVPQVISVLIF